MFTYHKGNRGMIYSGEIRGIPGNTERNHKHTMEILYQNLLNMDWRYLIMWAIGGLLIYLAIAKDMEPTLLLPIGFGTILVNLPLSGAIGEEGALTTLFNAGIANELSHTLRTRGRCRRRPDCRGRSRRYRQSRLRR